MPSSDATHFDDYRVQTLVKHKILEGYRRTILRLEERGRVLVCKDQAGKEPKPATARMRANPRTKEKEVTLGKDLWVVCRR